MGSNLTKITRGIDTYYLTIAKYQGNHVLAFDQNGTTWIKRKGGKWTRATVSF